MRVPVTILALALTAVPAHADPARVTGDCQIVPLRTTAGRAVVELSGSSHAVDPTASHTGVRCELYDAGNVLVASSETLVPGPAAATATVVEIEASAYTYCWTGIVVHGVDDVSVEGPYCIPPI